MENILGVIFCGGKATRLGGISKMDIRLGDKTLLQRAAAHLEGHVEKLALSMRPDTPISDQPYEIIYDMQGDSVAFALLSALKYAQDNGYDAILTLPVDTPFLPPNYASKLIKASQGFDCVYAEHGSHIHGLHSLWKTRVYNELHQQIIDKNNYKISSLYRETLSTSYIFTDVGKSAFLNINTPENLTLAQHIATSSST